MTIFDLLDEDHHSLRLILENLIEASTDLGGPIGSAKAEEPEWNDLFHDLKVAVLAHMRAEEAIFYERLRSLPHRADLADQMSDEHHLVESILHELESMSPISKTWETTLSLLKNELEMHMADEEATVFPMVDSTLTADEAEELGRQFEAVRADFFASVRRDPSATEYENPANLDLSR